MIKPVSVINNLLDFATARIVDKLTRIVFIEASSSIKQLIK